MTAGTAVIDALHDVARAVAGVLHPTDLARLVVERARAALDADGAVLDRWDPAAGCLRPLAAVGIASTDATTQFGQGVSGQAFAAKHPVVIDQFAEGESAIPWTDQRGVQTAVAVPLLLAEHAIGVLTVLFQTPGACPPEKVEALRLLAAFVAPALESARLYDAEQRARRAAEHLADRMTRLQAVTAALSQANTFDQVAATVIHQGLAALGASAGSLSMLDDSGAILEVVQAIGYPPDMLERYQRLPLDTPVPLAECVRTRQAIWLESPEAVAARYPHLAGEQAVTRNVAMAAIPLEARGDVLGALGLSFRMPQQFDAHDRAFVQSLAQQCAQALERARLFHQARLQIARQERLEQRLREEAQVIETLLHAGQVFAAELDPERLARVVVDAAREVTGATSGKFRAIVPDLSIAEADRSSANDGELRSVLAIPITARSGEQLGELVLGHDRADAFGEREIRLAHGIAAQAAIALDNARLFVRSQEAIRARDEFLSIASHELRTPVTGIRGYLEVLQRAHQRGALDRERLTRTLHTVVQATERLTRLTDDLLDLSRIRLGKLPFCPRQHDLVGLLREFVARFQQHAEQSHSIVLELPDQRLEVQVDSERLEQVLLNLLDNAVKYSPAGGQISVAAAAAGDGVEICVRDPGIGLTPGSEERIFEPFGRAPNAAREHIPGMGLGLHICRSIVERHGGRIWAESRGEGQGTSFYVWLPRGPAAQAPTER